MRGVIQTFDTVITGPTVEPLDLEEVKKARKFTPTTLDTLFDVWTAAGRQHFEAETGRQLMSATRERWMECFPGCQREIELPYPPLQSVVSVTYDDGNGDEQTLTEGTDYTVIAPQGDYCARGRIALPSGGSWPMTACHPKAVRIRYICGYGDAPGAVPELVKATLHFLIGHFHRFGEEVQEGTLTRLPLGAKLLIDGFKYTALSTLEPRRATWQA